MEIVIKIDEALYNTIMCSPNSPILGWREIAQSVPYNPSGDLISRSALREKISNAFIDGATKSILKKYIDNAQAIPLPNEQIAWEQGYEAGLAQGKVEITEEQAINKLHETGWLIGHDKEMTTRPQGEYISVDKLFVKCSICGNLTRVLKKYNMPNFCPACGADMRGEENEKSD